MPQSLALGSAETIGGATDRRFGYPGATDFNMQTSSGHVRPARPKRGSGGGGI